MNKYPEEFINLLMSITAKRPRTVIRHILKHGYITSQELRDIYGYNHPPRAIRDVREYGVPVETYRITGADGLSIAAYRFGNPDDIHKKISKLSGRTVSSKILKRKLIEQHGSMCFIYMENMDEALLQVDHRIPYEIAGEQDEADTEKFMLLSPSANRAKSWSCEHCINWQNKDALFCVKCFWAYPENYEHIAGKYGKTVHIFFSGNELEDYNRLIELSGDNTAQSTIKRIIHEYINQ